MHSRFDISQQTLGDCVMMVQDGAQIRYALPVSLRQAQMLNCMVTDWYSQRGTVEDALGKMVQLLSPNLGRKMRGRYDERLDGACVDFSPWVMLRNNCHSRTTVRTSTLHYMDASDRLARWIIRRGFGNAKAMWGFVHHLTPNLCLDAQRRGLKVIVDQLVAPVSIELQQFRSQASRWSAWVTDDRVSDRMQIEDRETSNLQIANHITCPSTYVRDCLFARGITPSRLSVIPYHADCRQFSYVDRSTRKSKQVTVGFVGTVGLRKGSPQFLEVAKRFNLESVRFVMVGPVGESTSELFQFVDVVGGVPLISVIDYLETFDLLLFPSTCEGSAVSVLQAMCRGLPVVTTPESGTPVVDGVHGFIRPYDDIDGLEDAVRQLVANVDLRLTMGANARATMEQRTAIRVAQDVKQMVETVLAFNPI